MTARDSVPLQRPFYFFVVLWGERFRDYFLEYCLPSLLAPGNIPALNRGRGSKFLIATRPDDWAAMIATPIFKRLAEYVEPVYIEIPPWPLDKSGCQHMGVGHKLASEIAYRDKAYAVMVTPDLMLSDGTVARVQELAQAGKQAVLVAALRFGEEPFLGNLEAAGAIPKESRRDSGSPLSISGRAMVAAAVNGLHSETLRYEWEAPYFTDFPCACWWKVPGEDGIVVHSFSWALLLLDYAAVDRHDTTALETWTIDGDYVYKNFGGGNAVHVVQDSDEMFVASWAPLDDRRRDLRPHPLQQARILGEWVKGGNLRNAYFSNIFDPLKRSIFPLTVRWHADELSPAWTQTEEKATRTITKFISFYELRAGTAGHWQQPWRLSLLRLSGSAEVLAVKLLANILKFVRAVNLVYRVVRRLLLLAWAFLTGDKTAPAAVMLRLRYVAATATVTKIRRRLGLVAAGLRKRLGIVASTDR